MFVAIHPPDDVVADLEDFLGPRRDAAGEQPLRWTPPEHWHLTLAFMESVPDRSLDDLLERLARAGRRRTPVTLAIAGGGAFPNIGSAKVLYAGVEPVTGSGPDATSDDPLEEVRRLAVGARAAANRVGAPADGASFRPHLTLARMGRPIEATRWVRVLSAYRSRPFCVEEFSLVASHLGEGPRRRPRYEVVDTFPLGPERPDVGAAVESRLVL